MKHLDLAFGTAGTVTAFTFNYWLGTIAGLLTVAIMALRLRREWKNRNKPPE